MATIRKPFMVLPLAPVALASGNEKASRPLSHAFEFKNPGMVWETTGASGIYARGDLGSARDIDFLALLATNAVAGATFRLRLGTSQAEVDGTAPYDSGTLPIHTIAGSGASLVLDFASETYYANELPALAHSHLEIAPARSFRWFRIDIGGHSGDFRCMDVIIGKKMEFADFYNGADGLAYGSEDLGEIRLGNYGVAEELDGILLRTLDMNFGWMSDANRKSMFQPMVKGLGLRGAVYVCVDPEPTVDRNDKTYFGWLRELPFFKPSTWKQDRWSAPFRIRSMI